MRLRRTVWLQSPLPTVTTPVLAKHEGRDDGPARCAREGATLYDPGFPFLRSWLYGLGGFVVVTVAFAVGFVIANNNASESARNEVPSASVAASSAEDVIAAPSAADPARFPEFAPEGVIVVRAQTPDEHATVERATAERRADNARRSARPSNIRRGPPPDAVARADAGLSRVREMEELQEAQRPERSADASRESNALTRSEASPASENEAAQYADERSWYGSAAYWREVEERRRAERDARRR